MDVSTDEGEHGLCSRRGFLKAGALAVGGLMLVYRVLGIDPGQTLRDFAGRSQYLLDDRDVIADLV